MKWLYLLFSFFSVFAQAQEDLLLIHSHKQHQSMSLYQVQQLYLKKVPVWPDGSKVRPIQRNIGSQERATFIKNYINKSEIDLTEYWIENKQKFGFTKPTEVESSDMMIYVVAHLDGSIGYINPNLIQSNPELKKHIDMGRIKVLNIKNNE